MRDTNGDEEDGLDETILPMDFKTRGQIVDDEMHAILVKTLPAGVRLTVIFDSCHSGTALDLPYVYTSQGLLEGPGTSNTEFASNIVSAGISLLSGRVFDAGRLANTVLKKKKGKKAQQIAQATKSSAADVIMFSGCRDDQVAVDTSVSGVGNTGAMSWSFTESLKRNHRPSYLQLLNSMRELLKTKRFNQIPQLSSSHPMDMNQPFFM